MKKRRVEAIEKYVGGVVEPWTGEIRLVEVWDDDPIPIAPPGVEFVVLNIIRTPHRAARPTNGDGEPARIDALAEEVDRLQAERDRLKAHATPGSERRSDGHRRKVRAGVGIGVGTKRGER